MASERLDAFGPGTHVRLVLKRHRGISKRRRSISGMHPFDKLTHTCNFDIQCRNARLLRLMRGISNHTAKWAIRHDKPL